jgi:hypothetical protein
MLLKGLWKKITKTAISSYSFLKIFFKKTLFLANEYNGLLVALATVALTLITYFNIDEAKQMREQTKRLADGTDQQLKEATKMRLATENLAKSTVAQLTEATKMRIQATRQTDTIVEQFKIRAYPSLLVIIEPLSIEDKEDSMVNKFTVTNRGEITAFHVKCLTIYVFKTKLKNIFIVNEGNLYGESGGDNAKKFLDFDFTLPAGTQQKISVNFLLSKLNLMGDLKNFLIVLQFNVPYDQKMRYETFAYSLEDKPQDKKVKSWQSMSISDSKKLLNSFILDNERKKDRQIKEFFSDYKKVNYNMR